MRQRRAHLPRRQVRVGMPHLRFAPRTGLKAHTENMSLDLLYQSLISTLRPKEAHI